MVCYSLSLSSSPASPARLSFSLSTLHPFVHCYAVPFPHSSLYLLAKKKCSSKYPCIINFPPTFTAFLSSLSSYPYFQLAVFPDVRYCLRHFLLSFSLLVLISISDFSICDPQSSFSIPFLLCRISFHFFAELSFCEDLFPEGTLVAYMYAVSSTLPLLPFIYNFLSLFSVFLLFIPSLPSLPSHPFFLPHPIHSFILFIPCIPPPFTF